MNWETHIFHIYYCFNIEFSLITKHTGTKTAMHVVETNREGEGGGVFRSFDVVHSFCFIGE